MVNRRKILLTEEQAQLSEKAKKKTEVMCDLKKKRSLELQGKGYLDFADEVVAGLYYGYKSGEIPLKELCKRVGVYQNTNKPELFALLMKHPRWAMLSSHEIQTLNVGSVTVHVPIGQLTDDKSLYSMLRFNIARLMSSGYPSDYSMGCRLLLNAYNLGVISREEKEEELQRWTHVFQEGEKKDQTFITNQQQHIGKQ